VRGGEGIVLLFDPPFDHGKLQPGYIKGYVPGTRENGGQYTHAALWVVMAVAQLGNGDEAVELFHMLNPINHARTPADLDRYKAEPYVVAADIYTRVPHIGRGGWTWYTGSAAWMYRLGLESILGLRPLGPCFAMAPCIPASWERFRLVWNHNGCRYRIEVRNPDRRSHGVASATLDGRAVDPDAIPLASDGGEHRLLVVMGEPSAGAARLAAIGAGAAAMESQDESRANPG